MLINHSNFQWLSVKVLFIFKCCSYIKHMFFWTVYNEKNDRLYISIKGNISGKNHFVIISKTADKIIELGISDTSEISSYRDEKSRKIKLAHSACRCLAPLFCTCGCCHCLVYLYGPENRWLIYKDSSN